MCRYIYIYMDIRAHTLSLSHHRPHSLSRFRSLSKPETLKQKREQRGREQEMEAAAIKIQSRARGVQDRKHVQVSSPASMCLPSS